MMYSRFAVWGGIAIVLVIGTGYVYTRMNVDPNEAQRPLVCSPDTQTARTGQTVSFIASGGDAPRDNERRTYSWSAPEGTPSTGLGQTFKTAYFFKSLGPKTFMVTVDYGDQSASCTVRVGVVAPAPSPTKIPPGCYYIPINCLVAPCPSPTLTCPPPTP